jgi:hypothetical protein
MTEKTTLLLLAERAEYLKKEYGSSEKITIESVDDKYPDYVKVTIHGAITSSDLLYFLHAGTCIGMDNMKKAFT